MKAFLPDGNVLTGSIKGLCIGYAAEKIEIDAKDVKQLIHMLDNEPICLKNLLRQLQLRFISERVKR